MNGKAMVVCMSRRNCVDLYNEYKEFIKLRPDWASVPDDDSRSRKEALVNALPLTRWAKSMHLPHISSKLRRKELAKRFEDT